MRILAWNTGWNVSAGVVKMQTEAVARLDGPPAEQNLPFPFGHTADDQAGILVVNVAAGLAHMTRQRVTGRNTQGDASAATNAILDHGRTGWFECQKV